MRDALSLFDQVIAYAGEKISLTAARESIGWTSTESLLNILSSIYKRDPKQGLETTQKLYESGTDFKQLNKTLIELFHSSILIKIGSTRPESSELSAEEWDALTSISEYRSIEEIELFFQVFSHGMDWIARAPQPKTVFEVLMIKCSTAEYLTSASALTAGDKENKKTVKKVPDSVKSVKIDTDT